MRKNSLRSIMTTIRLTGVSRRVAATSQAASLLSTVSVNLVLLALGSDELASYAVAAAAGLLIVGLGDAGLNQEYMVGANLSVFISLKLLLLVLAVVTVGVTQLHAESPWVFLAACLYLVGTVAVTAALAASWRGSLFRLDVAARIAVAIGTVMAVVGSALVSPSYAVPLTLAMQGLVLAGVALTVFIIVHRLVPTNVTLTAGGQRVGILAVTGRCLVRGLPSNVVSNGLIVAASLAAVSGDQIASLRLTTLTTMGVGAALPWGAQHFAHFNTHEKSVRVRRLLSLSAVGGSLAFVVAALHLLGDRWSAVAVGLGVGPAVAATGLVALTCTLSPVRTASIVGGSVLSFVLAGGLMSYGVSAELTVIGAVICLTTACGHMIRVGETT